MKIQSIIDSLITFPIDDHNNMQQKHIAIAMINNRPIIQPKTNYIMDVTYGSIHAEIDLLYHIYKTYNITRSRKDLNKIETTPRKVTRRFKNIDIVVIRLSKNGMLKNSKPCIHCTSKLKEAGCNKVYYSTDDNEIVVEKIKNLTTHHKCCYRKHKY